MDTVFYYAAIVGGTVLVLQTLLMLLGIGGDAADADLDTGVGAGDLDADSIEGSTSDAAQLSLVKVLTIKGVIAFLTFFGLAGMLARSLEFETGSSATIAAIAGLASMFLVAWLMASLTQLQSSGTLDPGATVGSRGRVYLRVPADGAPGGRVLVDVGARQLECKAVTDGPELPVGAVVQVMGVVSGDVLQVRAAS